MRCSHSSLVACVALPLAGVSVAGDFRLGAADSHLEADSQATGTGIMGAATRMRITATRTEYMREVEKYIFLLKK